VGTYWTTLLDTAEVSTSVPGAVGFTVEQEAYIVTAKKSKENFDDWVKAFTANASPS